MTVYEIRQTNGSVFFTQDLPYEFKEPTRANATRRYDCADINQRDVNDRTWDVRTGRKLIADDKTIQVHINPRHTSSVAVHYER